MNQSEIREQNIQKVLQTAQDLFLRDGVADTSINSIAEHCGLSPMSIYRYFKTKDILATRVWQMSMIMFYDQYFMPAYLHEAAELQNGYEKFLACTRVYIRYYTEHPEWFAYTREMFQIASRVNEIEEKDRKDENWRGFFKEIPIPLLKALSEGKEDGSVRPDVNIYEVYQVFTNVYTGTTIYDSFTEGVTTMDIMRYTAQLLAENIRNDSEQISQIAQEA